MRSRARRRAARSAGEQQDLAVRPVAEHGPTASTRITALATMSELTGLASQLCDLVRLRSGALPDDVAILLARAGSRDRKGEPLL